MRIPDTLAESLLTASGKANADQIKLLHEQSKTEKKPLQDLIIRNNLLSEKDLTKLYAKEVDVPYIELKASDIKHDYLKLLPERVARQYNAVVFGQETDGTKLVALEDPDDIQAINFLRKVLGNKVKVHITTTGELQSALDQYRGNISSELTKVISTDDIVPEDGLGSQLAQRPGTPLPVDRVKPQNDPDDGPEDGDELDQGEELSRRGEEHEEHEGGLGHILEFFLQARPYHKSNDHADHQDQVKEEGEPGAAEMIGQLLATDGDDSLHGCPSLKYFM